MEKKRPNIEAKEIYLCLMSLRSLLLQKRPNNEAKETYVL